MGLDLDGSAVEIKIKVWSLQQSGEGDISFSSICWYLKKNVKHSKWNSQLMIDQSSFSPVKCTTKFFFPCPMHHIQHAFL